MIIDIDNHSLSIPGVPAVLILAGDTSYSSTVLQIGKRKFDFNRRQKAIEAKHVGVSWSGLFSIHLDFEFSM